LAEVPKGHIELADSVPLHASRDADPAGLSQAFEARGNIDPVTENVAVLDDDIALVDADPQINAALGRERSVSLRHLRLYFSGAVRSIDGAGEFGQEAVARGLDHAPVMGGDGRIDQFGADGSEAPERALLVGADQPRVPGYIRGENGGKAAARWHFCRIVEELLVKTITLSKFRTFSIL
jgi:hypothetical protein